MSRIVSKTSVDAFLRPDSKIYMHLSSQLLNLRLLLENEGIIFINKSTTSKGWAKLLFSS